jgi:hypothetical protein
VVLAGAGVTYAATGSDQNQVGTEYANGIQVSDNQIIKPLGDRLLTQFGTRAKRPPPLLGRPGSPASTSPATVRSPTTPTRSR